MSTDKTARLLLELCRQGPAAEPYAVVDGIARYRWEAQGLGRVELAIPVGDDVLVAAVARMATKPKAWMELVALLVRLVELDGVEGAWCCERVAELLYGPRRPGVSSHRERQTPPVAAWVRLLSEGSWSIDTRGDGEGDRTATPPRGRRRGKSAKQLAPLHGLHLVGQPLVSLEWAAPSSKKATLRLHPELRACLGRVYVQLPAEELLVPQAGHVNPEGHRPSLAAQGRIRIAAAICARWRQHKPQPVKLDEVLGRWAGLDTVAVRRRGRLGTWFDTITERLTKLYEETGTGLSGVPARRGLLDASLSLMCHLPRPGPAPRAGPAPSGPPP